MATRKVRVGVIGASATYGWAVRAIMPALAAVEGCELVAVCTAHAETAQESAKKWGAPRAFHDHREMLADPNVDAVIISVRVPQHYQLASDVLHAGKHVYTEWPMASNLGEAEAMADLASSAGIHHMIGLQTRMSPVWLQARQLLGEGCIGDMLSAHLTYYEPARFRHPADRMYHARREAGVNTLTVAGGHVLDIFSVTAGEFSEISSVVGTQVKQWQTTDTHESVEVTAPDHIMVTGTLENGAVATVRIASVMHHAPGLRFEVYGTAGTLELTSTSRSNGQFQLALGREGDSALLPVEISASLAAVPESAELDGADAPFLVAQALHRWVSSIQAGEQAGPDFNDGLHRMALLAAVERASETGERQPAPTRPS